MKKVGLRALMCAVLAVISSTGHATLSKVEELVTEARAKVKEGDLAAAAKAYYEALQLDNHNADIRSELQKVLIQSSIENPQEEETDASKAILEGSKVS